MDLSTTLNDGLAVITIAGSMDAVTVNDFDTEWKKAIEDGAQKIIVEMSGVEYISSAGLRGILMLAKSAKAQSIKLAFAGMQSMVSDMFKLSGFYAILTTYPDKDAAIAAFF